MPNLTRRSFMGAGVATIAMGATGIALADTVTTAGTDTSNLISAEDSAGALGLDLPWGGPGSAAGDWIETPAEIKALGGCTMPLAELNRRRKLYVDSFTEDYTCEDGTVIPSLFVRVTRLVGTYGIGIGNAATDASYQMAYQELTEEEAECFLDMPLGRQFTAFEFAAESGRSLEQCEMVCDALFNKAWINRTVNDRGTFYCQVPLVQGILEYHDPDWYTGKSDLSAVAGMYGIDVADVAYNQAGSPFFGPVPINAEVVEGGALEPYDDVRAIWATKNKFSLSPCTCRLLQVYKNGQELDPEFPNGDYDISDVFNEADGHRLETCLSCGEEAQFWIDHGVGREISYEEAMEVLDKSVEEGLILQRIMSKECETICSCHSDCCGVIGKWKALGGAEALANSTTFKQATHYVIQYDADACIKCGACAERCPMEAITMDGEDGAPQTSALCFACGQCVPTCPAQARVLVPKPKESYLPAFDDIVEMNNMLAAQRFEAGLFW